MITKTTIYTRPTLAVAFPPSPDPALSSYVNATYGGVAPKLLSKSQSVNEAVTKLTVVMVFSDEAAMNQFDNDPQRASFVAMQNAYIAESGITVETIIS